MSNYYADVIDVLQKEHDWRLMVFNIAKKHPKAVIEAAEVFIDWKIKARELYLVDGNKIDAIKHCRKITNMSLKDALDAVNDLR